MISTYTFYHLLGQNLCLSWFQIHHQSQHPESGDPRAQIGSISPWGSSDEDRERSPIPRKKVAKGRCLFSSSKGGIETSKRRNIHGKWMGLEDDSTKKGTLRSFSGGWLSHFFQIYADVFFGSSPPKMFGFPKPVRPYRYAKTSALPPIYIEPGLVVVDDLHANHPAPSTNMIQSQQILIPVRIRVSEIPRCQPGRHSQ